MGVIPPQAARFVWQHYIAALTYAYARYAGKDMGSMERNGLGKSGYKAGLKCEFFFEPWLSFCSLRIIFS